RVWTTIGEGSGGDTGAGEFRGVPGVSWNFRKSNLTETDGPTIGTDGEAGDRGAIASDRQRVGGLRITWIRFVSAWNILIHLNGERCLQRVETSWRGAGDILGQSEGTTVDTVCGATTVQPLLDSEGCLRAGEWTGGDDLIF